jgi:hypothetical protein
MLAVSPSVEMNGMSSHMIMNSIHDAAEAASPEQLAAVDLNLLVIFDALARERSVTRAEICHKIQTQISVLAD